MNMRIVRTVLLVAMIATLFAGTTGCQREADKASTQEVESKTEAKTETETTEAAETSAVAGGERVETEAKGLAKGFPKSVPVEENTKIKSSSSAPDGKRGTGYEVEYYSKETARKAATVFKAKLIKEGWTVTMSTESEGTHYLSADRRDQQVSATFAPEDREPGFKTLASIVVVPLVK